jgi:hypothetical protein
MTLLVLDLARRLLVSSLLVLSSLPSSNRFIEFFDHFAIIFAARLMFFSEHMTCVSFIFIRIFVNFCGNLGTLVAISFYQL